MMILLYLYFFYFYNCHDTPTQNIHTKTQMLISSQSNHMWLPKTWKNSTIDLTVLSSEYDKEVILAYQ